MATRQQIEASFPAVARQSQSAFNRKLRPLAAAGLIPSTPLGKAGLHLDHGHLAWMLLALAAPEPHLVVPVATKLAHLHPEHPRPGSSELHTGLAIAIASRGSAIHPGIERERTGSPLGWEVALSPDPLFAWMRWNVDGQELREYYVDHAIDPAITAKERSNGSVSYGNHRGRSADSR